MDKTLKPHLRTTSLALFLIGAPFLLAGEPELTGNPHRDWDNVCANCHGKNGNGRDAGGRTLKDAGFDFTDSESANARRNSDWTRIIRNGKNKMPAFKGMSDAEVKAMIAEVLRPFAAPMGSKP